MINGGDTKSLYDKLLKVAKRKTAQADVKFDDQGNPILEADVPVDYGDNVLIVPPAEHPLGKSASGKSIETTAGDSAAADTARTKTAAGKTAKKKLVGKKPGRKVEE